MKEHDIINAILKMKKYSCDIHKIKPPMSKIQPIDEVMYIVADPSGKYDYRFMEKSEELMIRRFGNTWEHLKGLGCTIQPVRVQITPIDNDLTDKQ